MKNLFFPFLMFVLLPGQISHAQAVSINELMASNTSTITDPDFNSYADWIELYNPGSTSVNIKDYYITDDPSNPLKYRIPLDAVIPANGYILLWADDMNTGLHVNFKLSPAGEFIALYNSSVVLVDSLSFGLQQEDISEGRYPDGANMMYKFFPASPGAANDISNIYNKLSEPVFSLQGGFYQSTVSLSVSHPEHGVTVRYTLDGKPPSENSPVFISPMNIDTTVAITVEAFKEGYIKSNPAVNTYFINFEASLPVFSIVTDPANFFSDTSGIYVIGTNGITGNCSNSPRNWNQDWERPVNLEFYETGKQLAFNLKTGVKINGGCSRIYPMKSLAFYFRDLYGYDKLNYRLFNDIPVVSFNNFILRSSGQDWWRTMFRDGMVQTLIKQGMRIAYQEYRPSLVFLNGKYWGIHNIREMLNDWYLKSHYHADISNIDLVEISKGVYSNNGDLNAYNAMITFLTNHNMTIPEYYDYIKSIADMDDYIDFQIAEIYAANGDWPGSNVKLWRERNGQGKWRWLIYDLDFTFGGNAQGQYYTNTLEQATAVNGPSWPNPPWSTLMFRKLLENSEFRNEFIQRFAAHMNTTFNPVHVNNVIDSLGAVIEFEIPRHKQRWPQSISLGPDWYTNVQVMKDFADLRQPEVRNHIYAKFNIQGSYTLIIGRNNPAWGKVYTHNIEVKENNSQNMFFNNIPLKLRAEPMPGYSFVRWEGIINSTSPQTEVIASQNSFLTAVFEPAEMTITLPVINEINYNSSPAFDTEDWIELYNPKQEIVDLTGWKICDDNYADAFIFPEGAQLLPYSYAVICRDTTKFKTLHLHVNNIFGNINFGLSSSGDKILLLNSSGILQDSVVYGVSGEWTSLPNGGGPTLSLSNPQYDNTIALNWRASGFYGTPGRINDVYSEIENEQITGPADFFLSNNYPNPFNPATVITWRLPVDCKAAIKVYNILGKEILTLIDENLRAGFYKKTFNAANFPSGIYFYQLKAIPSDNETVEFITTKKMVLLK